MHHFLSLENKRLRRGLPGGLTLGHAEQMAPARGSWHDPRGRGSIQASGRPGSSFLSGTCSQVCVLHAYVHMCVLRCWWCTCRCAQSCVKGAHARVHVCCVHVFVGVKSLHGAHVVRVYVHSACMRGSRAPGRNRGYGWIVPKEWDHCQQAWPARECGALGQQVLLPLPWIGWWGPRVAGGRGPLTLPQSPRTLTLPVPATWLSVSLCRQVAMLDGNTSWLSFRDSSQANLCSLFGLQESLQE